MLGASSSSEDDEVENYKNDTGSEVNLINDFILI